MGNFVKVIASKDGKVVQMNPKKPLQSYIQVEDADGLSINGNFIVKARRGTLNFSTDLAEIASKEYTENKLITGKIVVRETRVPQYVGHTTCMNPTTKTNALRGGLPYYRSARFTNNLNEMDEFLPNVLVVTPGIHNSSEALLNTLVGG